jgi:hypothetical protein
MGKTGKTVAVSTVQKSGTTPFKSGSASDFERSDVARQPLRDSRV